MRWMTNLFSWAAARQSGERAPGTDSGRSLTTSQALPRTAHTSAPLQEDQAKPSQKGVRLKHWKCPKCWHPYAWFDGTTALPPLIETFTCERCNAAFNAVDIYEMGFGKLDPFDPLYTAPVTEPIEVVGDTAYEMKSNLTDAQADALVAEYAALGLSYKKCNWKGSSCIITKTSAEEYKAFYEKQSQHWRSIKERVGYGDSLRNYSNTYSLGQTLFAPNKEWKDIVAFINANYSKPEVAPKVGPVD